MKSNTIRPVKVVEAEQLKFGDESTNKLPVVVEYDFFASRGTKRKALLVAPALFAKKKGDGQIADEAYDRLLGLASYFEGKNVLLRIHISRKDVKANRRMRVVQAAIGEVDRLMNHHRLNHVFIFDPLCMSMERVLWSKPV